MSAQSILGTIALSACVLASAAAFLFVAYTSFFGIAVIGLVIAYLTIQFELDADRPVASSLAASLLAAQLHAERDLTAEQRLSVRHEQSLCLQSARFFRYFGIALAVIGLCGGIYYQL